MQDLGDRHGPVVALAVLQQRDQRPPHGHRGAVQRGHVTRAALQPQGAVRFGRSAEVVLANPAAVYTQPPTRQSTRGPDWFRKFDRNGDGELSRNEFPGRTAEFEKLDADRDRYVTLDEAQAADKRVSPAKAKK